MWTNFRLTTKTWWGFVRPRWSTRHGVHVISWRSWQALSPCAMRGLKRHWETFLQRRRRCPACLRQECLFTSASSRVPHHERLVKIGLMQEIGTHHARPQTARSCVLCKTLSPVVLETVQLLFKEHIWCGLYIKQVSKPKTCHAPHHEGYTQPLANGSQEIAQLHRLAVCVQCCWLLLFHSSHWTLEPDLFV